MADTPGAVGGGPPVDDRRRGELLAARPSEAGVDLEHANAARMYDYFLGGAHHFAVDRDLAERVATAYPQVWDTARAQRDFLMRVVRYCAEHGIDQFLDLGSGIPTVNHVHSTARAIIPTTRVAYVDVEPVAVALSKELLRGVDGVTITHADIRDPAAVLAADTVTDILDFDRPVAVLAVGLLHFLPEDDRPDRILAEYRSVLTSGSYLALCHTSDDQDDPALASKIRRSVAAYRDSATPGHLRSRPQILELLGGHELVDPGLVDITRWRHTPNSAPLGSYAALACIP